MQEIVPNYLAPPRGHYSYATVHGDLVFLSGILPLDPQTGDALTGEIEEQAERCLATMDLVLEASGSRRDCVLRVTVYISDVALWGRVNAVYARFFGDHRPARTVVPVNTLHYGCAIELDAIAHTG